jgi:hypothetical protein
LTETFIKMIAELVFWADFYEFNVSWSNLFAKPMILYCIVFCPWSHSLWLKLAQGKGSNIIFVYLYVHLSLGLHFNLQCCTQFIGDIN